MMMRRFLCVGMVVAFLFPALGASLAEIDSCDADSSDPYECRAKAPSGDATSLLQQRHLQLSEHLDEEEPMPPRIKDLGEDLPQAYDPAVLAEYTVSAKHREAGARLLNATHGALLTEFMKMSTDMIKYWARVIQKVGQSTGPNAKQSDFEVPEMDKLKSIIRAWRTELQKFGDCPEDPMDMEACMTFTRCLIEPEVNKGIPAAGFATFMETQTEMETVILRDFELELKKTRETELHPCEGEALGAQAQISLFELSSEASARQRRAVATVGLVKNAADHMVRSLAANSSSVLLETSHFLSIWEKPCAALACDPNSWQDIMQAMHGHAAELGEVHAPGFAIREHVRSMRAAHRAMKGAAERSSAEFQAILLQKGQNAASNVRYDRAMKEVGGMLDGALMQLRGSKVALSTYFTCFSAMLGGFSSYVKKFPTPVAVTGAILSLGPKGGIKLSQLENLLDGKKPKLCGTFSLSFGFLIGAVPGTPSLVCVRAGISSSASVSWNLCSGLAQTSAATTWWESVTDTLSDAASTVSDTATSGYDAASNAVSDALSSTVSSSSLPWIAVSSSVNGAVVTSSSYCAFGSTIAGVFKCVNSLTIGVGLICVKFNLLTGESDY